MTTTLQYYATDHLGSRKSIFTEDGTVIKNIDYNIWGESTDEDASFTGKELDSTGLYYFNARYYDPLTCRFVTEDTAKQGDGWYNYCENNPLNMIDKNGKTPKWFQDMEIVITETAHDGTVYMTKRIISLVCPITTDQADRLVYKMEELVGKAVNAERIGKAIDDFFFPESGAAESDIGDLTLAELYSHLPKGGQLHPIPKAGVIRSGYQAIYEDMVQPGIDLEKLRKQVEAYKAGDLSSEPIIIGAYMIDGKKIGQVHQDQHRIVALMEIYGPNTKIRDLPQGILLSAAEAYGPEKDGKMKTNLESYLADGKSPRTMGDLHKTYKEQEKIYKTTGKWQDWKKVKEL